MKPILGVVVRYMESLLIFIIVAVVGVLMGPQGSMEKRDLEAKRSALRAENSNLKREISELETEVTLLRRDRVALAHKAKQKLGMALPRETVYVFDSLGPQPKQ